MTALWVLLALGWLLGAVAYTGYEHGRRWPSSSFDGTMFILNLIGWPLEIVIRLVKFVLRGLVRRYRWLPTLSKLYGWTYRIGKARRDAERA